MVMRMLSIKSQQTRMMKKFKRQVGIVVLQKVKEQGASFWDERTIWNEIILKV